MGKQLKGLTRTNYRFKLFSLFASRVKPANQLEDGMYPIHLICTGDLSQKEPQKDPGCKGDGKETHVMCTCTAELMMRILLILRNTVCIKQTKFTSSLFGAKQLDSEKDL